MKKRTLVGVLLACAFPLAAPAQEAEEPLRACSSQQELEQIIQSEGRIVPDGCWIVSIDSLVSEGEELCRLEFTSGDDNIISQLQDAAMPSEWWVRCDALTAAARPQ